MNSVPRQNVWVLVFFSIAGAVLFRFGCQLLDANGYSHGYCIALLCMIVLVLVYLSAGSRRAVR